MEVTGPIPRALALGLALSLGACGRDGTPAADGGGSAGGASGAAAVAGGAASPCAGTGHWIPCAVLARLGAAGLAPQKAASLPDLPALAVTPLLFTVGRSGLAVYLYADSAARARAARTLDTLQYVSPARELTMRGETTVIQNDNLLALLYSRIDQQRERVSDALTAGAPQPGTR